MTDQTVIDLGDRGRWRRRVFSVPWIGLDDDVLAVVRSALPPRIEPGGFVAVTEKIVAIAAGITIDAGEIDVSPLARYLAGRIRPRGDSLALSVPEKMQWVRDEVGLPRLLLAAACSAVTRPFGISGAFYAIAGEKARSVDGVRGMYPSTLIPPLPRGVAANWCSRLSGVCGAPVAIVDLNDRGGSIRACSPGLARSLVSELMAGNPLGARDDATPLAVLEPLR